jgi:hypothetical protein
MPADPDAPTREDLTRFALATPLDYWRDGLADARSAPTWGLRAAAVDRSWFGLVMAQDHGIAEHGRDEEAAWRDALTVFIAGVLLGLDGDEMAARLGREPSLID